MLHCGFELVEPLRGVQDGLEFILQNSPSIHLTMNFNFSQGSVCFTVAWYPSPQMEIHLRWTHHYCNYF